MDYKEKVIALLNSQELSKEQKEMLETIFPELNESEDERIRKELITFFINDYGKNSNARFAGIKVKDIISWLEKQGEQNPNPCDGCINRKGCINCENGELRETEQKPNPYSGTSFEYNGHTWGMCARDNGVEILIDGHIKGRVFTNDSNDKEMFIKALERVEEQNSKGYKLTDYDKNSWWEDFKAYTSCTIKQKLTPTDFSDLRTWKYIVDAVWTEKEGIGQYLDSPFTEEIAKKLQKRFGNIELKLADKVEPKFKVGDWVTIKE